MMLANVTFDMNNTYQYEHMKDLPILIPVIFVGLFCTTFNMFTITIILWSNKLRKPACYPLVSVLLGAALQSFFTAPLYVYRGMEASVRHEETWLCDSYRLPYFLCGHIMKASFMLLSFDRLVATKFPYRYIDLVTKRLVLMTMAGIWVVVLIVDLIPFLPLEKSENTEGCTYIPTKVWGLTVITVFDILPFVVTICSYAFIWKVAAGIFLRDLEIRESVRTNTSQRPITRLDEGVEDVLNEHEESHCFNGNVQDDQKTSHDTDKIPRDKSTRSIRSTASKVIRIAWEMKATRTSFIILLVYLICWGPLGTLYAIDHYCLNCLSDSKVEQIATARFVVKTISLASSFFLPLVYCWRTKEFRTESKRLLCRYCRSRKASMSIS